MVLFFAEEFRGVIERGSNVLRREVVIPLDILKTHAAGQIADDASDWHASSPDDGFAVTDPRVKHNTLVHGMVPYLRTIPTLQRGTHSSQFHDYALTKISPMRQRKPRTTSSPSSSPFLVNVLISVALR